MLPCEQPIFWCHSGAACAHARDASRAQPWLVVGAGHGAACGRGARFARCAHLGRGGRPNSQCARRTRVSHGREARCGCMTDHAGFYQLSPELLFFRDGFKSLTGERGTGDLWCIDTEGGHNSGGGIFLDLSLQNNISKNPCSALHWQAICQRVVIARVEELTRSSSVRPSRLRGCSTMPLAGGVPQTARMTAPPTFDDVEAMQESDCRGVWLRAWHETRCLMRHAERVQRTTVELGCDALIKQAFDRLDQLSHVLFTDASQFSLSHAFEMATRGESNTTASSQRVNVGKSNVPFVASEIEPFNQCSLRFCASPGNPRLMQIADMCCCCMFVDGEAFARYSTRVPYFGVLREMGMLKLPINQQVLLAK